MLNELALRKPTFQEGYSVPLADGQRWWIRKPQIQIRAGERDGGISVDRNVSFGSNCQPFVDVLFGTEAVSGHDQLKAEFTLLATLLRENYELTSADIADLIVIDVDNEASDERWGEIRDALMGIVGKVSAGG